MLPARDCGAKRGDGQDDEAMERADAMLQRNVESGPKQITSISCIFLANQCYLIFDSGAYKVVHFQQESAANVQESAAAQLRLWRECMRRYETVARDVGDTDARLMVRTVARRPGEDRRN